MSSNTLIRAISVRQPWAELIISGRKKIELRDWKPVYLDEPYRGRLWLHTGLQKAAELEKSFGFSDLYRGGYIGIVTLDLVVEMTKERWEQWREQHLDTGQFPQGYYAWVLSSPIRFKSPLDAPGKLGLYHPSQEIYKQLIARLDDAEHI